MTPTNESFILHWGEMGTKWGVNRTVAQIHALLFLSPNPLNAEEIAETLSVARSNVSNSLRELQGWGIVKVVHVYVHVSTNNLRHRRPIFTIAYFILIAFWVVFAVQLTGLI